MPRTEPAPPVAIDQDRALDDLDLRRAREQVLEGSWADARAVLAAARGDNERRIFRVGVLSEAAVDEWRWLEDWRSESPDDPDVLLLQAEALLSHAQNARGGDTAAATNRDQFRSFASLSEQAEAATTRAIEVAPDDPAPWLTRMLSLFASGRERRDDFLAALEQGRRRDPWNVQINTNAVSFLSAKWYGSHEEMFGAARMVANAAAPGSGLAMLPVFAHLELALREYAWPGRRTPKAWRKYFERRDVQQEVDWCAGKWRSPGPPRHALAMRLRGWEVLAYTLGGRQAQARAVFDEIGGYLGDAPAWSYWGLPPAQAFDAARQWAYGKGKPPF